MSIYRRGTVLHVVFPHTDGGEKPRYVLVVSDENEYSDLEDVVVVKISSTEREGTVPLAGDDRRGTKLAGDSFIHPFAIQTIHQDLINSVLGTVPAKIMHKVDDALRRYLRLANR